MKIYDYETFEKNYKNIKIIKLKKWKDITNKKYYSMYYGFWGESLAVKFSQKNLSSFYFVNNEGSHAYRISKQKFKDTIEYIEINSELEIE